ncbi:MAG: hypothetical protein AABX13_01965 [Nanoarchaeota archaeon]
MSLNDQLKAINTAITNFFSFIGGKLSNFRNLTLGEQLSYGSIGGGLLLILVAVVLFIV